MRSRLLWLAVVVFALAVLGVAQDETATITGRVTDTSGAALVNATVLIVNQSTGVQRTTSSNDMGLYVVPGLKPGIYRIIVKHDGFSQIVKTGIVLHVQDSAAENFELKVGSVSESVTVLADAVTVNTRDASVGTVIDQKFVSSIPLNGRSIQTLINLAPGMVNAPVSTTGSDQGQYSANGMRTNGNYFTVDGVSANFGVPVFVDLAQGGSGSLPATNIQGGFSNLVSVDALQEFKIQTSTFAPEFGRSPGAQISLVTRSGSNQWHGALFEYFRNDALDATSYFDTKKPPLRFNNFGGTFSGPIHFPGYDGRNRTFFFFSYEGQRFLLPQPQLTTVVPSLSARQNAPTALARQLLDAFPLPNGGDILDSGGNPTGGALLRASYSNLNVANAYSLRLDHNFSDKYSIFARYNHAPSYSDSRSANISELDRLLQSTDTFTLGASQIFTSTKVNEIRANYSRSTGQWRQVYDGFGGGKGLPVSATFLPVGNKGRYGYGINALDQIAYSMGNNAQAAGVYGGPVASNAGRSVNFVDNFSWLIKSHQLKFGFDYRWVSPIQDSAGMTIIAAFDAVNNSPSSVYDSTASFVYFQKDAKTIVYGKNFSLYSQDTYRVNDRLSMTYGVRWEIVPAPSLGGGKKTVTLANNPDLSRLDQSSLQLAAPGTPYYNTSYTRLAPRFGLAYQLRKSADRALILRAGGGLFYDLGSTPFNGQSWPYSGYDFGFFVPVPITANPLPTSLNFTPSPTNRAKVAVAAPDFTLPRTYQWNLTLEQAFGRNDTLTVGYVGSAGRKLLRTLSLWLNRDSSAPGVYFSPNFSSMTYVNNASSSDYNALQAQYSHRLSKGIQALLNYTWAHALDDSSSDSQVSAPGFITPVNVNRGNSSFDVRHTVSGALAYDVPTLQWNAVSKAILGGWSVTTNVIARSGLPFDVRYDQTDPVFGYNVANRRMDLVSGQPIWIYDPSVAGHRKLNLAAFAPPAPGTYGTLGRNALRGFSAWQSDFGLHRNFGLTERLKMEFRAEMFNVFNHPNFANPDTGYTDRFGRITISPTFGQATTTLARGFNGGGSNGGFNSLFQTGGPRSIQFALRIQF